MAASVTSSAVLVGCAAGHFHQGVSPGESTGQERGGTADLPLFRIKDHHAGPATEVSLPTQPSAMHADRRRCTWMYETRNETAQIDPCWACQGNSHWLAWFRTVDPALCAAMRRRSSAERRRMTSAVPGRGLGGRGWRTGLTSEMPGRVSSQ
jgi:hypothetical protein